MTLTPGARLGVYDITAQIGEGGMGQVFRATDSKLKRQVAIKVLPPSLAADHDRLARFQREAEVLASLNHPHIAGIYGLEESHGVSALVMELVEGEDLSQRLARGPIALDEALPIAKQIAEALEAAHEQGIIHRDLKPANVKVRPDGTVKVLDFGLAKALEQGSGIRDQGSASLANSPTFTSPAVTEHGVILGTAAYMAPEQAKGKAVDRRADIWAFGCVLYEMLTGTRLFAGDSMAETLGLIFSREPDLAALPPATPPRVRSLVARCLVKDPRQRLRDIGDARLELDSTDDPHARPAVAPASARWRPATLVAATLIGALAASGYWWIRAASTSATPAPMQLSVMLPEPPDGDAGAEISPDGKWIAYKAARDGKPFLFLRRTAERTGRVLEGTDGASKPFFSPDSQWIAFVSASTLKKIPVSGGSPVAICTISTSSGFSTGFVGGAWGADGTIVYIPQFNGGIWAVPSTGGTPRVLLDTDESKDRIGYLYPEVLPGGKGILFSLVPNRAMDANDRDIAVLETGASEPRIIVRGGLNARVTPTGHLVYARGDELLAVAFDLVRLEVMGTPVPVVDGLQRSPMGDVSFSIADTGTLLYDPFTAPSSESLLAIADRKGAIREIPGSRGRPAEFSVSADGRTVAARVPAQNDDVWTFDVVRGSPLRLTLEPGDEIFPQWSPDGSRIAFGSRTGRIFLKSSDGTGQRETIATGEFPRLPSSFSPDGKMLAFTELSPTGRRDVLLLPLGGAGKPEPFAATEAEESDATFSPDGRWIAYTSNETGRNEIFVRPIGAPGGRKRVTSDGGKAAAWSRSGRELFFLKGNTIAGVELDANGDPLARERIVLNNPKLDDFQIDVDPDLRVFDVLPDGNFVIRLTQPYKPPTHLDLVIDWFEDLKRLVPAGK